MLSIGRIGAGDGYQYLTRQVASMDAPRAGERLLSYYERTGYPPGQWLGGQAEDFGLAGAVSEEPMQYLYGECCHPTEPVRAQTGVPIRDEDGREIHPRLGRRMAVYRSVSERVNDRAAALGGTLTVEQREQIEAEETVKGCPQAVTGFDATFSAPKSVSVLWALGDERTREELRGAHEAAWRDAFAYLEREVAKTRLGEAGVAQVDVKGLTGAAFEHWYNRAGDPQLHTHVAISAMVQTTDGKWRRLDSRALYRAAAAAGERYTGRLMTEASGRLGVTWTHRVSGRSGTPLPEIAGIDDRLLRVFSTRSAQVDAELSRLVGEYKDRHGYAPTRDMTARLAQEAVMIGRPRAEERSWEERRPAWLAQAGQVLHVEPDTVPEVLAGAVVEAGGRQLKDLLAETVSDHDRLMWVSPVRDAGWQPVGYLAVARSTIFSLEEGGSTWTGRDMERAAAARLREHGYHVDTPAISAVVDAVCHDAGAVPIRVDRPGPVPESLRRVDGRSVFERRGEDRWTSRRVLGWERQLRQLAAVHNLPVGERTRRMTSVYGVDAEVSDEALVERVALADRQLAELSTQLAALEHEAAGHDQTANRHTINAERIRSLQPALREAYDRLAQLDTAEARLRAVGEDLARTGRRAPQGAERAALGQEAAQLRQMIGAGIDRNRLLATAAAADQTGIAEATNQAQIAARSGDATRSRMRVLQAVGREQLESRQDLATELTTRQNTPARVSLDGYLDELGVDQAAAMVRLADPARPLDALIGPAGSGKTSALAQLVRAHKDAGRDVRVLAPTAVAAGVLGEAVGVPGDTLHRAVGEWHDGRNLPAAGSLILVDEASMATTGLLAEVADLARAQGAMLRLVGDPRQLKAVGAGGGLQIVAEAAGSPELVELRRFAHGWEAAATLDLRSGQTSVIDRYEEHGRISAGGNAEVLDDVYRAWQTSPAGPAGTIMVASDNSTVQALNQRARTDLVTEGLVEAEGVQLADGSAAGVGDVIVTRRNDRTLPTGPNPGTDGFVRNRDRWVIQARGDDGSLQVWHVRVGAEVTLPAEYVAEHVELSYALTGHGAQGITVEEAHAIVQPGDSRDYLYVAASRGRNHNQLHVIVDVLEDEPHGYHSEHSPRDVLAMVLTRDEPASATEHQAAARARSADIGELVGQYRYGTSIELDQRLLTVLEVREAGRLLAGENAWEAKNAATRAEARGLDISQVIAGAPPDRLTTVESLVGLFDRARVDAGASRQPWPELVADVLPAPGPQVAPDMAAWLDTVGGRIEARRSELAATYTQEPAGEWAVLLGPAPTDPTQRASWAAQVAKVQVWREASQIVDPDNLLGPTPPSRDPSYRAWQRAETAATLAARIAAGDQDLSPDVDETPSNLSPTDPTLTPPATNIDGPQPAGPTL